MFSLLHTLYIYVCICLQFIALHSSIGLSKDDEDGYNSQAEEDTSSSVGGGASQVLAGLQHLRGICNSCGNRSSSGSTIGSKRDCFASAKAISRTSNAKENSTSLAMPALPGKAVNNAVSSKLQVTLKYIYSYLPYFAFFCQLASTVKPFFLLFFFNEL